MLKAVNRSTNEVVAIKKMKKKFYTWEECMQLREVVSFEEAKPSKHSETKEVIRENEELFFVFEYMEANLYEVMKGRDKPYRRPVYVISCIKCCRGWHSCINMVFSIEILSQKICSSKGKL